jgi:transposase
MTRSASKTPTTIASRLLPALSTGLRLHVVGDIIANGGTADDDKGVENVWQVTVTTCSRIACCPCCHRPSQRVHSQYVRTLSDVPCGDRQVRLKILVRKFFCDTPDCPRSIFAERLPELTTPHARRTCRLDDCLTHLVCEAGGQAGARLARTLRLGAWSSDTLVRLIRRRPDPLGPCIAPRVLGVDDWAIRKGQTYGTILCDLERRSVIDLLPDRDAETLSAWLLNHPGVEIICRDRANAYADGARTGAPHAIQIADRFHLLVNLGDVVTRIVDRHRHQLNVSVEELVPPSPQALAAAAAKTTRRYGGRLSPSPRPPSQIRLHQQTRRQMRAERWQEVCRLKDQGLSLRAIGRRLHMNKRTIARALHAAGQPPTHGNTLHTLHPFVDYLTQRWHEGVHNARQLHRELAALGHKVSYNSVAAFVLPLRQQAAAQAAQNGLQCERQSESKVDVGSQLDWPPSSLPDMPITRKKTRRLPVRHVSRLIAGNAEVTSENAQCLEQLCQALPELALTHQLAASFRIMINEHHHDQLDAWLQQAGHCPLAEFQSFAESLNRDKAAVTMALQSSWSSGQVEGQINRLKLIKRSMYGRAKLDLLRKRVLYKPAPS